MQKPSENIRELLARFFAGETQADEVDTVNQFRATDPAAFDAYSDAWRLAKMESFLEDTDVDQAWKKIAPQRRPNKAYWISGIAASLILIAMITFFLINRTETSSYAMLMETSARYGETRLIELPDGSSARLNAGSTLRYAPAFDGNIREVFLEGEAYFEVARNTRKPFIVHTGDLDIRVHGTTFNVEAYKGYNSVKVAVQNGRVSFYQEGKETEGVHLQSLQSGIFNTRDQRFTRVPVSESDFAWIDEKIIFDRTSLTDAILELNRWYDLEISLLNKDLGNCRISATFHHQTPEEVLNTITLMLNLEADKNGRRVTLNGSGCQLN